MDALLIYLLKSSGLLAMFYLAYILFMQKETFFTSNRWFLVSGLLTSAVLPLFFITKIIFVEPKPITTFNPVNTNLKSPIQAFTPTETIDWMQIGWIVYGVIGLFLVFRILTHLLSLFQFLNKKQVVLNKPFALVDVKEEINPFSFFKYIVFNSNKYSETELNTILNHEKVHSREKHSIDVLLAKLFCAVFWFNPFVWLYKKAILQNLEFIADQKAIQNIEDKKVYQLTLLKVVTDQHCFPITNNFYQSLIKKRIVMLNKNQSKKVNSWKYFLIIPALVGFVFLFQIKVQAQEKGNKSTVEKTTYEVTTEAIIDKNTGDKELKEISKTLKKQYGIQMEFKNVKRNSKSEITSITAIWNNHKDTNGNHIVESDEPIEPFKFIARKEKNGVSTLNFSSNDGESYLDAVAYADFPEMPEAPEAPEAPEMAEMPEAPEAPEFPETPNIKIPTDPNDTKAWKRYEDEMEKFAKAWENSDEIKKYEAQMEAYSKKMAAMQPDMSAFEAKMRKFEAEMEVFNEKMENYQEALRDKQDAEREALRDKKNNN